jgi:hypothetical protein
LGNTVRFYKFVDGVRSPPLGVDLPLAPGVWHDLAVECRGNQIRCFLGGKELFPPLTDNSFAGGWVGFFTKSDSVSHFSDPRVVYQPRENLAKRLVREVMADKGRLVGLRLCAVAPGAAEVSVVASSVADEVGKVADRFETESAGTGAVFHGRVEENVTVVMPLRDRNGEPAASVRVTMKRFPGQTRDNVLARARPIVLEMEKQVRATKDLFE